MENHNGLKIAGHQLIEIILFNFIVADPSILKS